MSNLKDIINMLSLEPESEIDAIIKTYYPQLQDLFLPLPFLRKVDIAAECLLKDNDNNGEH